MRAHDAPAKAGTGKDQAGNQRRLHPCRACGSGPVMPADSGYCQRCAAGTRLYRAVVRYRKVMR
jgi:hypothetical protein